MAKRLEHWECRKSLSGAHHWILDRKDNLWHCKYCRKVRWFPLSYADAIAAEKLRERYGREIALMIMSMPEGRTAAGRIVLGKSETISLPRIDEGELKAFVKQASEITEKEVAKLLGRGRGRKRIIEEGGD